MQYLWIGNLEEDKEFIRKIGLGYSNSSAQIAQKNLISGIEINSGFFLDSINGSAVKKYPQYMEKKVREVIWKRNNEASLNISVGFNNSNYLNRINCKKAMICASDFWIKNRYKNNGLILFVYSLRSGPLGTAFHIKKKIPKSKVVAIITDLPQFMDASESFTKKILKRIDGIFIKKYISCVDNFVLYSSKMAKYLNLMPEQWILMEGCFSEEIVNKSSSELKFDFLKSTYNFFYSGKLEKKYGIDLLLEAFSLISNSNVRLIICGEGSYSNVVCKASKKDKRIIFLGFIPNRSDVLLIQEKANCLLNMRLPSEKNSAYSFPSKLFEYMAASKPIISFNISSIPIEYKKYLFIVREENGLSLYKMMMAILNYNKIEIKKICEEERQFVYTKKNNIVQTKLILDFINNKIK